MIIEKLTKDDANGVPCDECGQEFDADGISIGIGIEGTEIGLCGTCQIELMTALLKVSRRTA